MRLDDARGADKTGTALTRHSNSASYQQEMGMGQATSIPWLEVYWPVTGLTQRFENVPLDQFLTIEEGATSFTIDHRKVIKF